MARETRDWKQHAPACIWFVTLVPPLSLGVVHRRWKQQWSSKQTKPIMTTTAGAPIADSRNALKVGAHGPVLMRDGQLIDELAHQNRERIPERVVRAEGLWKRETTRQGSNSRMSGVDHAA